MKIIDEVLGESEEEFSEEFFTVDVDGQELYSNKPVVNLGLPDIGNPVIALAMPLFILANLIRNQKVIPSDIDHFRRQLMQHINSLAVGFKKYGIGISTFTTARYLLCCYLDESILNTEWGKTHRWGFESLLSVFHNDTNGGENFFLILKKLTHNSEKNRLLIELAFVCLKLGFLGKYAVLPRGSEQLLMIEDELFGEIKQFPRQVQDLHNTRGDIAIQRSRKVNHKPLILLSLIIITFVVLWNFSENNIQDETNQVLTQLDHHLENTQISMGARENNYEN